MEPDIDLTNELVNPVEGPNGPAPEETKISVRSAMDLLEVPYEEMTDEEKKYFISALKMRNNELDEISKKAFEENRRLREARNRDLKIMEDTLTFIKTTVGNSLGSVSLAIKNMEREVNKYGN